jgi:hypothetical protein
MTDESDAPQSDPTDDDDADIRAAESEGEDAAALDAYDLDDDGHISLVENLRGEMGMVDARAEELAEEPGLKGKAAKVAHRLLDKLDND